MNRDEDKMGMELKLIVCSCRRAVQPCGMRICAQRFISIQSTLDLEEQGKLKSVHNQPEQT